MSSEPGTYLKMWLVDDTAAIVEAREEPRINASVGQWVDSGRTKDTLLELDRLDGIQFFILASAIVCWLVSTPDSRLRTTIWDKAVKDEEIEHKKMAGVSWDNDA